MSDARPPATAGRALAATVAAASVTVSAVPRILLAAGALPDALRPFVWSDVYATYADRLSGGRVPYADAFFDYPPGIGYLAGLFSRLAGGAVVYVLLWTAVAAAAAAIVAMLLARESSPQRAIAFWSLSPQLLLYGGSNFDVIPVALVLGAVVLARRRRSFAAIVLLALGALAKVFPAVAVPVELERIRRGRGIAVAVGAGALFLGTVLVIAAPSVLAPHPSTEGVLVQAARTNFDSVWGLARALIDGAGLPGATIVGLLSLAGLAAAYLVVLARADPGADPARLTLLALLALLLWTRLYSPQYSLWVLPFFALLGLPVGIFALLATADLVVFATVYPLTLVPWSPADTAPTLLFGALAGGIVLRHVALIALWRAARRSA